MNRREALKTISLFPLIANFEKLNFVQAENKKYPDELYGICVDINSGNDFINDIKSFESYVNFKHDIVQYFSSFDIRMQPDMITPYFTIIPLKIWNFGKIPMLTWYPSTSNVEKTPDDICKRIYSGMFDKYLNNCCQKLLHYIESAKVSSILGEAKLYIRLAHEMNYRGHIYSNSPNDFIKMWKYIYKYVRNFESKSKLNLSKDNVLFVFCPGNFDIEKFPFEEYYPGDEYVEWKGLDGYNWGGRQWKRFDEIFMKYFVRMNNLSSKPLSICEFGTTAKIINKQNKIVYDIEEKFEWIKNAYEWLSNKENLNKYNIRMSIYYNLSRNNDIDSGIFIPESKMVNKNTNSLNFSIENHNTIKNLSSVYIKKYKDSNNYNLSINNKQSKLGFVNNNINISQSVFEGKF